MRPNKLKTDSESAWICCQFSEKAKWNVHQSTAHALIDRPLPFDLHVQVFGGVIHGIEVIFVSDSFRYPFVQMSERKMRELLIDG